MLVPKEIRVVGLIHHIPKELFEKTIRKIVDGRMEANVSYEPVGLDKTSMVASLRTGTGDPIGVINNDDKRYLEQLFKPDSSYVKMHFLEYYNVKGETPILRYYVWIDLQKVKPIQPAPEWNEWKYSFPKFDRIEQWNRVQYYAEILREEIMNSIDDVNSINDMIDTLTKSVRYNISIETTAALEELSFMLEFNSTEQKSIWKNRIQKASTERRAQRTIDEFFPNWWLDFVNSDQSRDLRTKFALAAQEKNGITKTSIVNDHLKAEMESLEKQLQKLPFGLYQYVDNICQFYKIAFYNNIPQEKLIEALSGLALRTWLSAYFADSNFGPINANNITIFGTLIAYQVTSDKIFHDNSKNYEIKRKE